MEKSERTRLKQLANDAIIDLFGSEGREARLAVALEQCIDELDEANDKCPTCSVCEDHGDHDDELLDVDINEVVRIQGELKKRLQAFKDYHVRLSGDLSEWEATGELGTNLAEDLAEIIEETESYVDELEAEVLP